MYVRMLLKTMAHAFNLGLPLLWFGKECGETRPFHMTCHFVNTVKCGAPFMLKKNTFLIKLLWLWFSHPYFSNAIFTYIFLFSFSVFRRICNQIYLFLIYFSLSFSLYYSHTSLCETIKNQILSFIFVTMKE